MTAKPTQVNGVKSNRVKVDELMITEVKIDESRPVESRSTLGVVVERARSTSSGSPRSRLHDEVKIAESMLAGSSPCSAKLPGVAYA